MSSDRTLLVLSFLGCLLPVFYYFPSSSSEKSQPKLVIGVLSNLENFEQRKVIRSTWKKLVSGDAIFHFVLGDTFCPHNSLWRLSDESCKEWKLEVRLFEEIFWTVCACFPLGASVG